MNFNVNSILIFLIFLTSSLNTNAQKSEFSISASIGLNLPILDNGVGFFVGVNPTFGLSNNFSLEAQVSFASVTSGENFLTGEPEPQSNFNALMGGRLYILSLERRVRPYINLLGGGMYNTDADYIEVIFGFSSGVFVDIKQFMFGISAESPGNIIFKAGCKF